MIQIVGLHIPSVKTFKQTIKFGFVGGSGIIVNFIVLSISLYLLGIIEEIALALGILVSMTSNYLFNRVWTFRSENSMTSEYIKYITLNAVGIAIQYIVAIFLENYFDQTGLNTIEFVISIDSIFLASFIGIIFGFISNFLFSKYLVFSDDTTVQLEI